MKPRHVRGFQIRAGRALLGWSVADLSTASRVTLEAIERLEATPDEPTISDQAVLAVVAALKANGVVLIKDLSRYGVALDTRV